MDTFLNLVGVFIIIGIPLICIPFYCSESNRNDECSIITTNATLVDKSIKKRSRSFDGYYFTFETSCKERIIFKVQHEKYVLFLEGDSGKLSYQGTPLFLLREQVINFH